VQQRAVTRVSMDYDVFLQLAEAEGTLSMSNFERQFAEHAEQARLHGAGHPIPVAVNQVMSRLIVLVYRTLRVLRARAGFARRAITVTMSPRLTGIETVPRRLRSIVSSVRRTSRLLGASVRSLCVR
jgi:hypothetical protein